jgi:hypothetical protein
MIGRYAGKPRAAREVRRPRSEPCQHPIEADDLARHAELLGLGAAGGDDLGGARAVARGRRGRGASRPSRGA